MRQKQAKFQNLGHEELSYRELFEIANFPPDLPIVNHATGLIPRKIPREYIPAINHFGPHYDNLLFCICIENIASPRKYFYSPSMTFFATLMRLNVAGIQNILGRNDSLPASERQKIIEIMEVLKGGEHLTDKREDLEQNPLSKQWGKSYLDPDLKYKYIERKRLNRILQPHCVQKLRLDGNAYNAQVPSKCEDRIYECQFKQLVTLANNSLLIHPAMQGRCDCGYQKASFLKYEFYNILAHCHHLELIRQTLENPALGRDIAIKDTAHNRTRKNISHLFAPFSPLDNPLARAPKLRTILRKALHAYLVPQAYILENFDDSHNYHKSNGYTWFRCELDAFLLSFNSIYDPAFLSLWQEYYDERKSEELTCQYYGDVREDGWEEVIAEHKFNPARDLLEHHIKGSWQKVEHYARNIISGAIGKLQPHQYAHLSPTFKHVIIDVSIDSTQYQIFHASTKRKYMIDFAAPFRVARTPENYLIYIHPYKMRKTPLISIY